MAQNFIDISNHQSSIRVANVPTDALIVKATEGRGFRDKSMPGFVAQARSADKPLGFYGFVSQGNTPIQEADNLLGYTEPHRRDNDVLVLDWEPGGNNPGTRDVDWARRWLEHVSGRVPNPIWTYMNLSTANGANWKPVTARWPRLWLAHYPGNNKANGYNPAGSRGNLNGSNEWQLAAWQFTDGGRLNGFGGNLDLNQLYIPWWNDRPAGGGPVTEVRVPEIPPLRENDPPVSFGDSKGRIYVSSNGQARKGCVCMQLTMPLINAEMIKRGLIRDRIDVFQGGYNAGGVAASAGTHDMGGVIDVAQGITLDQRRVWAMFGVMMFPRTRQFGWTTGDHGHGVWHGCPHQTASADRQVTSGMNGRDGLVGNRVRNFEAPTRTWQDAYREHGTITITQKDEDPMPDMRQDLKVEFDHPGHSDYDYARDPDSPMLGADVIGPIRYGASATVHGPDGAQVRARLAFLDRAAGEWVGRSPEVLGTGSVVQLAQLGQTGHPQCSIYVDVWSDKPGPVKIEQTIQFWKL